MEKAYEQFISWNLINIPPYSIQGFIPITGFIFGFILLGYLTYLDVRKKTIPTWYIMLYWIVSWCAWGLTTYVYLNDIKWLLIGFILSAFFFLFSRFVIYKYYKYSKIGKADIYMIFGNIINLVIPLILVNTLVKDKFAKWASLYASQELQFMLSIIILGLIANLVLAVIVYMIKRVISNNKNKPKIEIRLFVAFFLSSLVTWRYFYLFPVIIRMINDSFK